MGKQNIWGKEAYCETFLVKMSFIKLHEVKESVFYQRLRAWPRFKSEARGNTTQKCCRSI